MQAGVLWDEQDYVGSGSVNHAVTLTGAVHNAGNGELVGFYISDSGRGKVNDMTRFVDIETFRKAADVANAYTIYTKETVKLWNEDIDATGNNEANYIIGNRGNNTLQGLAGDDNIKAQAGNDVITGGAGDDNLDGGVGNDTYHFSLGDGNDVIVDAQGVDSIVFGDGIEIADISVTIDGADLLLTINDQDSIRIKDTENGVIERIMFADGAIWYINAANDNFNADATGGIYLQGETTQGQTLTLTSSVSDADGMGDVNYQWQVSTDRQTWVDIVGATSSELTLAQAHIGKYVRTVVSYTDDRGALESVTTYSSAQIISDNHAPVVTTAVSLTGTEDQNLSITTAQLLANASDVDGDDLTVSNLVVIGNNASITNNNDGTWSLTPNANFNGQIQLSYDISDGQATINAIAIANIEAVNFDISNDINTTGELTLGDVITGAIETSNDTDWFRITLEAGINYQIDLEGAPTNAGTLSDTYLGGICDANGHIISGTNNDDGGVSTNSRLIFNAVESGTYYISAESFGSNIGTYSLGIDDMSVI
ncbi:MAG: hypothetical protein DSY43_05960 [Gammaproteobacteria bacterium]|nr:MAG: hypothetical protein DSY43_05960 [Gammaproteobacteria bacterium]